MGTRLYVKAKYTQGCEPESASGVPTPEEVQCNVQAGTAARLDEFVKSRHADLTAEDAWYEALYADEGLERLYNFRLFGYGRLTPGQYDYLMGLGEDPICGALTDAVQMKTMLKLHGTTLAGLLEAVEVSWS